MRLLACLFLVLGVSTSLTAQTKYFLGYENEIAGTKFTYHSPFSNSDASLLSRANKHFEPIEWSTEIIPEDYQDPTVSFVWVYGVDVLPKSQSFNIYVNDKKIGSFSNPKSNDERVWVVEGDGGAKLVFNRTMIDKHKDQMGFAVLSLPT